MSELQNILIVNKEVGETPLEALERLRLSKGLDPLLPMTYAGRLDPMAEGTLLVLIGEECKNKDKYLGLDKEYVVEILFGFETDTYDILGKITSARTALAEPDARAVLAELQKFKGKFVQEYPAYSSKTVLGVQLHTLANRGELPDIMPTKEVEIYSIDLLEEREVDSQKLLSEIKSNIIKVKGSFRQKEILDLWQQNIEKSQQYKIVKVRVSCSSGTYMRTLAHNLGKNLGIPAIAYSINRTRIGEYKIASPVGLAE